MPATQDDSQRNRRTAKRILAIGLPLVVIAGTGIGYAYWTTTGSGSGSATSTAPAGLTLTGTIGGVAPGKTVTVPIMAANGNAYRVAINTLTASLPAAQIACAGAPGSGTADITVGTPSLSSTAPLFVAANVVTPVQVGSVTVAMSDAGYNQDLCKNTTFTLTLGAS